MNTTKRYPGPKRARGVTKAVVLAVLRHHDGEMFCDRLASIAGISQAALSKHLKQLKAQGYIRIERRPKIRVIQYPDTTTLVDRGLSHV